MEVREKTSDGEGAAVFTEVRRLIREGDNEGALDITTAIADRATDPLVTGRALVVMLGRLFNLGRTEECPPVLDRAFDVLGDRRSPELLGDLYALAGITAARDSLQRCIRHLVQGSRELDRVRHPGIDAVSAWHDLAVTYSYVGFHAQAMTLAERCYLSGQEIGLPSGDHALPEVGVRWAVSLDHRGDTEACARILREVLSTWEQRTDPAAMWPVEQHYYGYAAVRLAALGEDVSFDPSLFTVEESGWEVADLRLLAGACAALAEGRPHESLERLAGRWINHYTLGSAEIHRVRALAHAAADDHRSALTADRRAMRVSTQGIEQLRDRLVDGTKASLDHEALRRTVEQYASEALTDPLTGLPNRRHFDRRITQLAEQRIRAAIGVIDLDGFKAVNSAYGHLSGDLVLQRVAAILARSLRDGDFVARYGGDEFVAVLPETDLATAEEVGKRVATAVEAGGWEALVADTPVSITVGWAELDARSDVAATVAGADRAMLDRKEHVPAPPEQRRTGGDVSPPSVNRPGPAG